MNRLAGETSPYLLQHAENPVDWSPWDQEALRRARIEDRPIFLSIGYAACHWCHVMERESFEDEQTASFLNANFVPIKVDREERPDLDAIYMDAVQAMTGQGGWPLSAFLTPDGRPFFAGTYFPKEAGRGLPSFRQVLDAITEAWRTRRPELEEQGARILETISRAAALGAPSDALTGEITHEAFATVGRSFDEMWGGFGAAPKFPQPMILEFVLRMAVRGAQGARQIITRTLDRMAAGGIYDQLGGGFARYSTDATWHVPHFEKMLYDNAQLAQLYTRAWLVTREDRYQRVATAILEYLIREMRHPEGGFFSSQDADSEGIEGKFFSWTWDELVSLVGTETAMAFGAKVEGNWKGTNILWFPDGMPSGRDLSEARAILLAERETRVRPATDDKILTAWNAMAIQAFAEAGRVFGRSDLLEAATRAADFAEKHLADPDGRVLRSWRDGVRGRPGFCDDHALLASALLTLFGATGEVRRFKQAARLVQMMVDLFADRERGGFFQTSHDDDPLVVRPKDVYDNAVPSGNSAAAHVLLRLSLLTGDLEMERMGIDAIGILRDALGRAPMGFGHALSALDLSLGPAHQVAIVGAPSHPSTEALVDVVLRDRYLPNMVLAVAAPDDAAAVPLLRNRPQLHGDPTAYVCRGFVCTHPTTEPATLKRQLDQTNRGDAGENGISHAQ
jgi:hypothetical protein